MTDRSPEQEPDTAAKKEARLGAALTLDLGYVPPHYETRRQGPGRWTLLEVNGEPLGYLYTNDADVLGFAPTTDAGIVRSSEYRMALNAAKASGTPATVVFDAWAARATLGLSAGPVQSGDLDTLANL